MNPKEQQTIDAEIDLNLVDWDNFIRRWLLYAARYIPGNRSINARNAEDLVFQSIDAVLSGRRHYARPNLFDDSDEADHETPFFVYVCSVIRAMAQSAYRVDKRFTELEAPDEMVSTASYSASSSYDNVLLGNFGTGFATEINPAVDTSEKMEQLGEISAFQKYLRQNSADPLLSKIMDMILNPHVSDMSAPEKATLLGVELSIYNNGIKRFKRQLDKFLQSQQNT